MKFKLVPPSNDAAFLVRHIEAFMGATLSAFLEAYRVEVSVTGDESWRRDCIVVRVLPDTAVRLRAVGAMSFNWYHRDSIDKVKQRLEKRLLAFAERIKPKLKPRELMLATAERRQRADASKAARAQADAEKNEAQLLDELDRLESLLEKP